MLVVVSPTATFPQVVGSNIRQHREDLGWTQERLAAECQRLGLVRWTRDIQASTESGRRSISLEDAIYIAAALGITITDLLAGTDADPPRQASDDGNWLPARVPVDRVLAVGNSDGTWNNYVDISERFRVTFSQLDAISHQLWGRDYGTERLSRLVKEADPGVKPRVVAARRATAVRAMYQEIANYLEVHGVPPAATESKQEDQS
jgi:DNA-binding XRE family transcriptional regulator